VALLYSSFNLVLALCVGFYAMFNGYKGVAGDSLPCRHKYFGVQAILCACMLALSIAPAGAANGWINIVSQRLAFTQATQSWLYEFWMGATLIESFAWTANCALAVYCMRLVFNYAPQRLNTSLP
jgi:hypothetical protein